MQSIVHTYNTVYAKGGIKNFKCIVVIHQNSTIVLF